jgi:hypothetical protein
MKLEVITTDETIAYTTADEVVQKSFDNFSGIVYIDRVDVLYAHSLESLPLSGSTRHVAADLRGAVRARLRKVQWGFEVRRRFDRVWAA